MALCIDWLIAQSPLLFDVQIMEDGIGVVNWYFENNFILFVLVDTKVYVC